jgi:hypothetical protein
MMTGECWTPINEIFVEPRGPKVDADSMKAIEAADIVLGRDTTTKTEFLIFGRDDTSQALESGDFAGLHVFRVELDQDSEDHQKLVTLVEAIKGDHDDLTDSENTEPAVDGW